MTTFPDFWANWPHKRNRHSAEKAFAKLKPDDRQKAADRASVWCMDWRKENPQAAHIHASTYLNQRRFLDSDEVQQHSAESCDMAASLQARAIKAGLDYLCRNISPVRAGELIRSGLVTEMECRKVGLI